MLMNYIQAAMGHAKYEILPDDGSYYGEISECSGVYANAKSFKSRGIIILLTFFFAKLGNYYCARLFLRQINKYGVPGINSVSTILLLMP